MLRLVIFLIFLVASVWLGLEVIRHPGYLLIAYQPWIVQMPLWFVILSVIIILLLFYFLIETIERIQGLGLRFKNWLRFRRERQSFSKTQQGLAALIEGKWKHAENLLLAGAHQAAEPLMNYLGAAKAAQELIAFNRRDQYIQKAYQIAPHASLAIGISQAQLEIEQHQLEHAAATLNHLLQISPRHAQVLRLLEKTYTKLGDWTNLLSLLPNLRKSKILTNDQMILFEKNLYCALIKKYGSLSLEDLHKKWNEMPRNVHRNPDVVFAYVQQLLLYPNTQKEIEEIIRNVLKQTWQPDLVNIYGDLTFTSPNRQLVMGTAWLKLYGQKPELLLLLGKICVQIQLWGKAKDYFEKCLTFGPNAEASLAYGKLLERLDDYDEAIIKYKEGLAQCAHYYPKSAGKLLR